MTEKNLDYKKFVDDFEEWTMEQVKVFIMAEREAQRAFELDKENMDAATAMVVYHSRLEAYDFLLHKFENFRKGKDFHDLPDGLLSKRTYE
ncbi:protein of unknown function [Pilibacter termitis]|uniref:Uncharacterized protein n=1 Tax=Pilibacter termitis TaxID=263852 RepID=A0A1T4LDB8_9ENTE|nr:DUF1912 family protein [Pilibacter termitis]SJZ52705.1 protein of unknown function [Pilibacter termitis]